MSQPGTETACRVVVVDDHGMVRESIGMALARADGIEVVGSAASVGEGHTLIVETRPDVAVLDYSLPDGTGIDLARSVGDLEPPVRTVILTASEGVQAAAEAVAAGCAGFVRKSADLDDLSAGVLRVHAGEALFDAQTLSAAIGWLNRPTTPPVGLTERELDVLRLLAEGRTTVEISESALPQPPHGAEPRAQHPGQARRAVAAGGRRGGVVDGVGVGRPQLSGRGQRSGDREPGRDLRAARL